MQCACFTGVQQCCQPAHATTTCRVSKETPKKNNTTKVGANIPWAPSPHFSRAPPLLAPLLLLLLRKRRTGRSGCLPRPWLVLLRLDCGPHSRETIPVKKNMQQGASRWGNDGAAAVLTRCPSEGVRARAKEGRGGEEETTGAAMAEKDATGKEERAQVPRVKVFLGGRARSKEGSTDDDDNNMKQHQTT